MLNWDVEFLSGLSGTGDGIYMIYICTDYHGSMT